MTIAAVAGAAAFASAFVPGVPLTGLLVLPVALTRMTHWRQRFAVALAFETVMAAQLIPLLLGYGVSAPVAIGGVLAVVAVQSLVLASLPVWLGLALLLASPISWGHPIFACLEITSVHGIWAVVFALGLLALFSLWRWQKAGMFVYALSAGMRLAVPAPTPAAPPIAAIDTAFTARSLLPATDWAKLARKIEALPPGQGPGSVRGLRPDRGQRPVALPESTLERDLPRGERYFGEVAQLSGRDLLLGVSASTGPEVVAVSHVTGAARVVYRQRWPIPALDWRPWTEEGARAHPLGTGIARIGDMRGPPHRLGFLICYERYLAMPWLETLAAAPDAIVVIANDRWSRGTLYPEGAAKIRSVMAWAAGVPVVSARNI